MSSDTPDIQPVVAETPPKKKRGRPRKKKTTTLADRGQADYRKPVEVANLIDSTALQAVEAKEEVVTEPWNPEQDIWSGRLLRTDMKRPGYTVEWHSPESQEKARMKGFVPARWEHYGKFSRTIPGEEGRMTGVVQRREMVLMEIPTTQYEELVRQKRARQAAKEGRPIEDAKRYGDAVGIPVYDKER